MVDKNLLDDQLRDFILVEKGARITDFKNYYPIRNIYGSIEKALEFLGLKEALAENKKNARLAGLICKTYSNEQLKNAIAKFYAENGEAGNVSECPFYQTITARFGSINKASKELGLDVRFLTFSEKITGDKVSDEQIKKEYKAFLLAIFEGNYDAKFYRRTLMLRRYKTTDKADENYGVVGLKILNKAYAEIDKNDKKKMEEKEKEFINNIKQQIATFVADNY